ncbi:MAG: hypothetical protein JNG86_01085, partial [Verrucomicrobiaceae bacterium]|nr:hypothetical protein [Verrucomicrobiaceae bacterium]
AAHRLWFCFPGYPHLPLMLDTAKGELRVDSAHRQTPVVTQARILSTIEQKTFDSVAAFWASLSKEVEAARFDSALRLFDMERAPELFNGIENIAFESFQITPYPGQSLIIENGELRLVGLELRHRLKGQRGTNAFFTPMFCRMAAQQDGTWRVKALTFPRTPAFWCRGFTQIMRSARFHVVHKDTEDDRQQARLTAQTLEAAYDSLLAAGLPMSATYVAFHCSSEGDFQILSGADPAFASGAAPGQPIEENGRLNVYNLAIYANDTTYRKSHTFGDPQADQIIMLRHELVHLALGDWTRPWSPGWLVEGMAVYFSGERMTERPDILAGAIRGGLSLRTLTGDSHLRPDNGDALGLYLKYQLSARVVEWIARHHGEASLLALYTAFGAEFPALWQRDSTSGHTPETSPAKQAARVEMTELLLKKHLGTSISQIEAAVGQEIMKAARR